MRFCLHRVGLVLLSVSAMFPSCSVAAAASSRRALIPIISGGSKRSTNAFAHHRRVRQYHEAFALMPSSSSSSIQESQRYACPPFASSTIIRPLSSLSAASDPEEDGGGFFADPTNHPNFASIGIKSPVLIERVEKMLSSSQTHEQVRPSAVQAAAFQSIASGADVAIGAETGSGKTFGYLLPLIDDILKRKQESQDGYLGYDYARAIVLVPNKELASQVVRMASELCGGKDRCVVWEGGSAPQTPFGSPKEIVDGGSSSSTNQVGDRDVVRLAIMPGGLGVPKDFRPFRMALADPLNNPPVDIVVTTPASLGPMALSPKNIDLFADVRTVIIDEADMLLDGGYIRQLENVLMGFRRADKLDAELTGVEKTQHVLVAATLPDVGLKSVDAYIGRKFPYAERVAMDGLHNARHYGLRESTVWIEDAEGGGGNKARMETLVNMLQTPSTSEGGLKGEKVMVFLNSVDDVDGATGALCRAGLNAVPYHAKISLSERADNLDRFRRYDAAKTSHDDDEGAAPILVCTDLASRGLDVPGVTAIVQLQFAGNVVAHLHRMGRCGRAGKRNGRGVVFYGETERELVEVVREAEHQQETMALQQDVLEQEQDEEGKNKPRKGSVQGAFSRKRGFTKKRKKERRKAREASANGD